MDTVTKEVRSRIMSKIKSKNTLPERLLAKEFRRLGIRFVQHSKALPGKPDFVFPQKKWVLFVDGDFFHGCPRHGTIPKSNKKFWTNKILTNQLHDRRVDQELLALGWTPFRVWECVIKRMYG